MSFVIFYIFGVVLAGLLFCVVQRCYGIAPPIQGADDICGLICISVMSYLGCLEALIGLCLSDWGTDVLFPFLTKERLFTRKD